MLGMFWELSKPYSRSSRSCKQVARHHSQFQRHPGWIQVEEYIPFVIIVSAFFLGVDVEKLQALLSSCQNLTSSILSMS